jgi:hypothetical protein
MFYLLIHYASYLIPPLIYGQQAIGDIIDRSMVELDSFLPGRQVVQPVAEKSLQSQQ